MLFRSGSNITSIIYGKDVPLTPSEAAVIGGQVAKNLMDIVGPHFVKAVPRTAAQMHVEKALINDKIRKTPFGWRRKALIKEKVKYFEKLGKESLELEKATAKRGLLSRLKGKLSVSPKIIRIITRIRIIA